VSDKAVKGANYGAMYGWARLDHEAQVVERCVKLGAVMLSPAAPQAMLTTFAHAPSGGSVGFEKP